MFNSTLNSFEMQGFIFEKINEVGEKVTYHCHSSTCSKNIVCPYCRGKVKKHGYSQISLRDVPSFPGVPTVFRVARHRFQCLNCGKTCIEADPFTCPGFHLTQRAVEWICRLLSFNITTKTVAQFMGIHWNTVRKIQQKRINEILELRDSILMNSDYRPTYLAVDEFAIHKGHRYATCVMDLITGSIIWVGKGRDIKGFQKFFEYFDGTDYLEKVQAVAMDMNASYNVLVAKYLPNAEIVYDQYHVLAQYGRDVLGVVRLEEARKHKERAKELAAEESSDKEAIRIQKQLYTKIKNSRWPLLYNPDRLSDEKRASLNEILAEHSDLAVCYAMRLELVDVFKISDPQESAARWIKWFEAAESSEIEPLKKFARLKRKRIPGLIAHAKFHINTGKLEGFNNKIKVIKRDAFGFRNNDYFFSLIRYVSLPKTEKGT